MPMRQVDVPQKKQTMREICELLEMDQIQPTAGSSIPSIFFSEIASKMGVPSSGTMPVLAKRIIEFARLPWKLEYSSEHAPSGGGGTVTNLGLVALKNAVLIWKGDSTVEETLRAEFEDWNPPTDWEQLRAECEREENMRISRPGSSEFRTSILKAYGFKCAISGNSTVVGLEAAHIVPYFGFQSDVTPNGICLRVDIHRLFDQGYLGVSYEPHHNRYVVYVHDEIAADYVKYHGKELSVPEEQWSRPSVRALEINQTRHRGLWI